mmetsp:Transcript_147477/g.268849  ORF Transcript_147477/g.268849 Transcript_147477/m.268849 type:complete len:375 (+) Transcript_147477:106-1230(+)
MAGTLKKATNFNRQFEPEFLQSRKDCTPAMLAAAKGDADIMHKYTGNMEEVNKVNRDGNNMLLLAVAKGHVEVVRQLLDARADLHHKNQNNMDALDYAVIESIRSPMAKEVLKHVDFITPEVFEGPYEKRCRQVLNALQEEGYRMTRTQLAGKTPDFADLFSHKTEYRTEWTKQLIHMASLCRKGVILLHDDIGYLERDAMLSGALEVPMNRRWVYLSNGNIQLFARALRSVYAEDMEQRMIQASFAGHARAIQGLLKAKAQPNIDDNRGQSVLMRASHNGDILTMQCLLAAKARVNNRNKDGYTALHLAAVRNNAEAVKLLLRAKGDIALRSHKGNSVSDFAKHEGHADILKVLTAERERKRLEREAHDDDWD